MVTTAQPAPLQQTRSLVRAALGVVTFAALWLVLCRYLSAEWYYNEQYNYGWFVPFFALYLFWLRWERRPAVVTKERNLAVIIALGVVALFLLLPLRLFEIANPGWRPLDWSHTSAVATLTLLAIYMIGGKAWLRHFAFPIGFFFLALPWFTGIEEPVVQGLMRVAAAIATEGLNLLGIPAQLQGSVIRVSAGAVGVNEACSGVRSLQTSLMIGFLFGELYRLNIARRALLVIATVALALAANCVRAFFLVWLAATRGLTAMEHLHDMAGYAILLTVFAGSIICATWFRRGLRLRDGDNDATSPASALRRIPTAAFVAVLAWIVVVEIGVETWYRLHERDLIPQPQWTIRWPESAPAFHDIQLDERTRRFLRFNEGRGVSWREDPSLSASASARRPPSTYLLYFFRWRPGHNSALLASLHRPDVCLPAVGWEQSADHGVRYYPVTTGLSIPFRHFEFLHRDPSGEGGQFIHAFYCLWEDRVRRFGDSTSEEQEMARGPSEWTRTERARLVAEGRRHLGQQVMEIVISGPKQLSPREAEDRLAGMLDQLILPPSASIAQASVR